MKFKTRELYPDELRILKRLKTQTEKESGSKSKFYCQCILAVFLGIIFTYLARQTNEDSFWFFLFGTIVVFSFGFVVFMPYEVYKKQEKNKNFLQRLKAQIEKRTVEICCINATRIALAKEYEDEGDWYIVEICKDKVLYLWDITYNLNKKFPCLQFEIYEDNFFKLTEKQIYPLSEKIKPVIIDKNKKWKFMEQIGVPRQMITENISIENISFDELINKIEAQ